MNLIPAYRSFSAGEVSPLLRDRHDTETHNSAVATMRNMVPDPRGPAKTRNGTKKLNTIVGATNGVIKVFQATSAKYFDIVFVNAKAWTFTNDGVATPTPSFITPYLDAELDDIHIVHDPDRLNLWVFHKNHPTARFTLNAAGTDLTYAAVTFTAAPAYWGSAAGTYPATGTIHKGKLWLANGTKIWASKPQARTDMTTGTTAADGFEVEMEDSGEIRWLSKSKNLIVGTDFGEYIITSQGSVIYIGDISIDQQSQYGSKSVQPSMLGDKLGFISGDGRKLYATQYDRNAETWVPVDITFFSEHITAGNIKDFVYQPHPDNLGWFTDNNGDYICSLYNRSVNVYGWSRHDTNGTVNSMAGGEINGVGEIVSVVDRNGTDLLLELTKSVPLDSYVYKDFGGTPGISVTGLDHMEGKTVHAISDGYNAGSYVVSSGAITLAQAATIVYVGLAFDQELILLPVDEGSQRGSGRVHLKRYKDIFVGLIASYLPKINGETPPDIAADVLMDTAPDTVTGLVNITDMGFDRESPITITQDLPFNMTITGVFGTLTQEKL